MVALRDHRESWIPMSHSRIALFRIRGNKILGALFQLLICVLACASSIADEVRPAAEMPAAVTDSLLASLPQSNVSMKTLNEAASATLMPGELDTLTTDLGLFKVHSKNIVEAYGSEDDPKPDFITYGYTWSAPEGYDYEHLIGGMIYAQDGLTFLVTVHGI